jgi:hypothetical protein
LARTIVYIDGFNLYYRLLKGTLHKWLDIAAMSAAALPSICQIARINYYTHIFPAGSIPMHRVGSMLIYGRSRHCRT